MRRRSHLCSLVLTLTAVAALAGCTTSAAGPSTTGASPPPGGSSVAPGPSAADDRPPGTSATGPGTSPGTTGTAAAGGHTTTAPATPPPWSPTTVAAAPLKPPAPPCPEGAGAHDRIPPARSGPSATSTAVTAAVAELQRSGGIVSVAVSEASADLGAAPSGTLAITPIAVADPERRTVPASNQKLLIAAAVLEAEGPDATFETTVVATGPIVGGVVQGDLVLVGGGDPTLTKATAAAADPAAASAPSLEALAQQTRARGITQIEGRVLVDERRFDQVRFGAGGSNGNLGPMSALIVDRNRAFDTPDFATDPARSHAAAFAAALTAVGVEGPAPGEGAPVGAAEGLRGERVASVSSAPMRDVVAAMLSRSDNMVAEALAKDLGFRTGGPGKGTTADGLASARRIVAGLCVTLDGTDSDSSGLSLANRRTAGGIQRLLEVAMTRPWWPAFRDGLAVAGRTGTLAGRMTTGAATGRVRAKSGSVGHARALSGYVAMTGGHTRVFSILVDNATTETEKAIDTFVTTLAATP